MACRKTEGTHFCGSKCCLQCGELMITCGGCEFVDRYEFAENCIYWVDEPRIPKRTGCIGIPEELLMRLTEERMPGCRCSLDEFGKEESK